MECAAHPGTVSTATCAGCARAGCDACVIWDVDGRSMCEGCGAAAIERGHAVGSAALALIAAGYLVALAIGYLVFRARPFVGGLAAIASLVVGRLVQTALRAPIVTRRAEAADPAPATAAPERRPELAR